MSDDGHWEELVDRHLRGELSESEQEQLAELLDRDSSKRRDFVEHAHWDTRFTEVLRESRDRPESHRESDAGATATSAERKTPMRARTPPMTFTRMLLAIAAIAIVALTTSLYFQRPSAEPQIATVTGLSGPLQWTGNGGRVLHELKVGDELPGGAIEGLAPDSWFELEFRDGSTITISGNSMLTFADQGRKLLYFRKGNLSADVKPQPPGNAMLIYTRSAMLEVLGTQFGVEAAAWSTVLNVSKGEVRIERLSDGSSVVVPAQHRVVTGADGEMSLVSVPDAVNHWQSSLDAGPDDTLGDWVSGSSDSEARLRTVPFSIPSGQTIFAAGIGVSCGDSPPVVLQSDSRIRVRGRISAAHRVFFGLTVRHTNGECAGKFQTIRPADEFAAEQNFDIVLHLRDYRLDPSLDEIKDRLPSDPFGLVVESIWCHTLFDPVGLEITEVELVPPDEEELE